MGQWDRTRAAFPAVVFLFVAGAWLWSAPIAVAHRRVGGVWMDGLIRRVEPMYREITLWDHYGGVSTWDLQVTGSVDLTTLKVGDLVRVLVDRNRRAVFRLYKLTPPQDDDDFRDAIRRLETETGHPVQ